MLNNVLLGVVQALVVIAIAPFFTGLARVMRAKIANRRGPSIWQDYRDLSKLLSRPEVRSKDAGLALRLMPLLFFAVVGVLCAGIPMFFDFEPLPVFGDILTDIYLLALARFFFSLAGLDTGSAYGGVGGVRELVLSVLVEPSMMLALFTCALVAGSTDVATMGNMVLHGTAAAPVAVVVAGIAFAVSCYIELGKVPFDAAEAEQELQEGPLQELSGPNLALAKLAMGMKQVLVVSWFVAIFLPFGQAAAGAGVLGVVLGIVFYMLKVLAIFLLCGVIESSVSRVRFKIIAHQTWAVVGVAAVAFVLLVIGI